MHYYDIEDEQDKIVHILYAVKVNDALGMGIVNLTQHYGEDKVQKALKRCKELYPFIFK